MIQAEVPKTLAVIEQLHVYDSMLRSSKQSVPSLGKDENSKLLFSIGY
jgi:hypothetical protein